ncbi:MAG: zinc metallopeptidase [Bacillota bacterium]
MFWTSGDVGLVVFVLPALVFSFWAQARVRAAFERYSRVGPSGGKTGAQVAAEVLRRAGLTEVGVLQVSGELTDHYDPRQRVVCLSPAVYGSASLAALGVAAHEAGHAIQHAVGYRPLAVRNSLAPAVGFGSQAAVPLFFLGLIFGWGPLLDLGLFLMLGVVAFAVLTLPVEYDASRRALAELQAGGYLRTDDEVRGAREVLNAAALTYVAALAVALAQLLRMALLREGRRR